MPVCLSSNPRIQLGADLLHSLAFLADPARCHSIEGDTAARLDEWRRRLAPEMAAAAGGLSPGVPSVPDIGADGRQREREDKKLRSPISSFSARDARARRLRTVLAALTAAGIGGAP